MCEIGLDCISTSCIAVGKAGDESKCGSEHNPEDTDCCAPNGEAGWCRDGYVPRRTDVACWSLVDGARVDDVDGMFTCMPPPGAEGDAAGGGFRCAAPTPSPP